MIEKTTGVFTIEENQDDKIYSGTGGGATTQEFFNYVEKTKSTGNFRSISFINGTVNIEKSLQTVKEPKWPILRKIVFH